MVDATGCGRMQSEAFTLLKSSKKPNGSGFAYSKNGQQSVGLLLGLFGWCKGFPLKAFFFKTFSTSV